MNSNLYFTVVVCGYLVWFLHANRTGFGQITLAQLIQPNTHKTQIICALKGNNIGTGS